MLICERADTCQWEKITDRLVEKCKHGKPHKQYKYCTHPTSKGYGNEVHDDIYFNCIGTKCVDVFVSYIKEAIKEGK